MNKPLHAILLYLRAFLLIWLFLWCGNALSTLSSHFLPGSIIGMLLLFFALSTKALPEHWVAPACHWFLRYMALFFVPVSVGLMKDYPILLAQFLPIVVSSVISTLLVLLVVAYGIHLKMHKLSDESPKT